jgi:hypothetical protein
MRNNGRLRTAEESPASLASAPLDAFWKKRLRVGKALYRVDDGLDDEPSGYDLSINIEGDQCAVSKVRYSQPPGHLRIIGKGMQFGGWSIQKRR